MKNIFNFVLWVATMSVILGAHFTAIPALVMVTTVLYWISSIVAPLAILLVMLQLTVGVREGKKDILIEMNGKSNLFFVLSRLRGLVALGVYATVGWAWPFAMCLILWVMLINARLNKE